MNQVAKKIKSLLDGFEQGEVAQAQKALQSLIPKVSARSASKRPSVLIENTDRPSVYDINWKRFDEGWVHISERPNHGQKLNFGKNWTSPKTSLRTRAKRKAKK